jgi:DNA repair exonuclease SbcCD ATPase subunit
MTNPWHDLESQLQEVADQVRSLQERLQQVRTAEEQRDTLRQEMATLEAQDGPAELIQKLRDRLDLLEVDLESRLLTWESFKQPFWQVVRFGGMGILVGAALRSCAA